jgi:hypothetical protein
MPPRPKRVCSLETVWIREFAKTYLPSEAGLSYSPQSLREAGISLIGIRNILRRGYVVFADKLNGPGARWIIEGDNNDGEKFRLTVTVITEQLAVDLDKVEKLAVPVEVEEKSDGHDAA